MTRSIERFVLRAIPIEWRDSVEQDLREELPSITPGMLGTFWFVLNAVWIGAGLRWQRSWRAGATRPLRSRPPTPLLTDMRYTVRGLRRVPWYTTTVVGVIALGMALATTIFAVVDGVLFKPLPFPEADRLFVIRPGFVGLPPRPGSTSVSLKDLRDWSASAVEAQFTGFVAQSWSGFGEGVNDDAAGVASVQRNVFDVLAVHPLFGGFVAEDFERQTKISPVIIRYDIWERRFGGDPNVIGQTVEVDRSLHVGYRIVGVMPAGFVFPTERADVKFIRPMVEVAKASDDPRQRNLEVLARVAHGVSAEALRSRVEAGMSVTASTFPPLGTKPAGWSDAGWRRQGPFDRAEVQPLSRVLGSQLRPLFRTVFLAVVVLVAIGVVNVSGLMVARTLDRLREIGVRRALGASGAVVARLLLLESFMLFGVGALIGFGATPWLLRLALSLLPDQLVLLKTPSIDWRVAGFVLSSVVALAIPATLWPIGRAVRSAVAPGHSDANRASERHRSVGRFVVVTAQVAGGFVLTLAGALLVGSLLTVYANELPGSTNRTILIETFLQGPGATLDKSAERTARMKLLLEAVRKRSDVREVAATSAQLLRGGSWPSWFKPPQGARDLPPPSIDVQGITPEYFHVLRPQLIAGRLQTPDELARDARLLVVSEGLARAYWPLGSAIGQTLIDPQDPEPFQVVGVVKDVHWFAWDQDTVSIYAPYALVARAPSVTLLIEANGPVADVQRDAMQALVVADPLLSVKRAALLVDVFRDSVRARRFQSWLFGAFAAAGLVIVGAGLLGLLAMTTARRSKEVGIRHALGATPSRTVQLIVGEQLIPVGVGLIGGGTIALWAVSLIDKYLYRITTHDPRAWFTAAALIVTMAIIGSSVPAWRASRVDPMRALRLE